MGFHLQNLNQNQLCTNAASTSHGNGNTRRHTVGPGDVAHEQALQDPNVVPLDFKCEPRNNQQQSGTHPPINLPMLQNQPLHYLTIKDQHLLKPPLVMGASKYIIYNSYLKSVSKDSNNFNLLKLVHSIVVHQMAVQIYRTALLLYNSRHQWRRFIIIHTSQPKRII